MATQSEMTKETKEALINQRIEEIRRRNEEILRRYQEIENDKLNAETLSKEAIEWMKRMPRDDSPKEPSTSETSTLTSADIIENPVRPTRKERPVRNPISTVPPVIRPSEDQMTFRPQRLSEADFPPPDPAYSYLTDRLREGALCSPISPPTQRRRRSSAGSSYMSVGGSSVASSRKTSTASSSSSRKLSTASNSSWTSDTSSRSGLGFANYQPPRKYSATRDYVKNRRISQQLFASAEETEGETCKGEQQQIDQLKIDNTTADGKKRWIRRSESSNDDTITDNVAESKVKSTNQTRGIRSGQKNRTKKSKANDNKDRSSEMMGNWRVRVMAPINSSDLNSTESSETAQRLAAAMEQLTISNEAAPPSTRQDLNNNDSSLVDRNVRNSLVSATAF